MTRTAVARPGGVRRAFAVVITLFAPVAVGCSSSSSNDAGSSSTTAIPADVATVDSARTTPPVTAVATEVAEAESFAIKDPDWLAADESFVYVKLDSSKVLRLDPLTGNTLGTTDIGGELCQGLGAAFDSVWSCRGEAVAGDVIVRIDPATDEVVATIDVDKARMQGNLVGGFERLWVLGADGTQLFGIDPATNTVDPPIDLGTVGAELTVGPDAVWVISSRDGALVRVDPVTRAVVDRMDALDDPFTIDVVPTGIWIGMTASTVRVDPTSLEIVATIPVGPGHDGAIDVDGNDLWIRSAEQLLVRVDTTAGAEVERFTAPISSGGDVLVAAGAVWATAYDDTLLVRHAVD